MATALVDNWTEMNCIQLIREFRARPILWDQKDPFYYKKFMKPEQWEQIGEKLDIPALECKHKMNILMSSFRREKAKIMNKIEDNNGDNSNMCVSTWFAFKEMTFLMDKEAERKRRQKGSDNADETEDSESSCSLKRTLLKHHMQPPISNKKRPRSSGILREIAKETSTTNNTPAQSQPAEAQSSMTATSSDTEDEIKSFSNFISFKMKKYSETTKNAVQKAICDIIFKADQHFYDKFVILDEKDSVGNTDSLGDENIKEEYDDEFYIEESE